MSMFWRWGKVAFDRLKNKDLSYFQLDEEDLSPEAVELGFLEHVQPTSLSEVDQYGFRHLTVQEHLAALYACSEVVKKAGDVAKLVEELGCGPEAGHLNTFWVFVAGLLDSSRHEELFGAIAGGDMETCYVHATDKVGESSSAENAQIELVERSGREPDVEEGQNWRSSEITPPVQPLPEYRFLLMLHCYDEATVNSSSTRSARVVDVLNRWVVCESGHSSRGFLSPFDTRVISTAIARHSDMVEKVDLSSLSLDEAGMQRLLPALNTCTQLKELHIGLDLYMCLRNYQTPMRFGSIVSRNSKNLEVLTLSTLIVEGGVFDGADDHLDTAVMQQLKCLELWHVQLKERDGEARSCIRHLPALRKCVLTRVLMTDSVFNSVVAPSLQMCKHLQTLSVQFLQLTDERLSAFTAMLISFPELKTLKVGYDSICDEDFLRLAPVLGRCSQLRHLQLFSCGLTTSLSMALLASVLPCLPHLEELCINSNQIGDAGLAVLLLGLEECFQLTVLSMANIRLTTSDSLLAIANLLERLCLLVNLDLSGNNCCDMRSAIQLCSALEQHPSLEALNPPVGIDDDIAIWLDSVLAERARQRSATFAGDTTTAYMKTTQK